VSHIVNFLPNLFILEIEDWWFETYKLYSPASVTFICKVARHVSSRHEIGIERRVPTLSAVFITLTTGMSVFLGNLIVSQLTDIPDSYDSLSC
jgi:hypothetical protein